MTSLKITILQDKLLCFIFVSKGVCNPLSVMVIEVFFFVFAFFHQSVTPFLRGAPPPEKNLGSAPDQ